MGDIFVAPVYARQAPWWRLTTPGQVSRGAASPTDVFSVGVAAAPGPVAVPKAPEAEQRKLRHSYRDSERPS